MAGDEHVPKRGPQHTGNETIGGACVSPGDDRCANPRRLLPAPPPGKGARQVKRAGHERSTSTDDV